ncbi:MAG TPA: 2-hydroxyacid dehydrogenase [Candidatus Saccharimonadales bacterium]|nr:2-hydroxyacid dehydrogenase [Candidatus Saccharimonadales bacterium]
MEYFKQIICLDFIGSEYEESNWQLVDQLAGKRLLMNKSESIFERELSKTDCLLVKLGAKVGRDLIDKAPNLRYIGMLGTGYGGIDVAYAAKKGITVTNITDYATESVAEFFIGMLLDQLRDLAKAKAQAKAGDYSDGAYNGSVIKGKTIGVVGLGNIGLRTAELAQAFGANVIYWSKHRKPEAEKAGIKYVSLNKLLATSDVISLNLALNQKTEGILNAKRVMTIKKGAIVINPSPMELINFPSLTKRLKKGDMTLILDHSDEITTEQDKILQTFDNCVMYPPIGYLTAEATQLKRGIYIGNIRNYLAGKPSNTVS